MSCTLHIVEALLVGVAGASIALVFVLRNNPRMVARLGITLPAAK